MVRVVNLLFPQYELYDTVLYFYVVFLNT